MQRPARRRVLLASLFSLSFYLTPLALLDLVQDTLIFPGRYSHGLAWANVTPPPGTELLHLTTSTGVTIAALFGHALTEEASARSDRAGRPALLYFYGNGDCLKGS